MSKNSPRLLWKNSGSNRFSCYIYSFTTFLSCILRQPNQIGQLKNAQMQLPICLKVVHDFSEKIPDRIKVRRISILLQLFYLASYDNQIRLGSLRTRKCSCPYVQKQSTTSLKKFLIEYIFVLYLFFYNFFILHPTTTKSDWAA